MESLNNDEIADHNHCSCYFKLRSCNSNINSSNTIGYSANNDDKISAL